MRRFGNRKRLPSILLIIALLLPLVVGAAYAAQPHRLTIGGLVGFAPSPDDDLDLMVTTPPALQVTTPPALQVTTPAALPQGVAEPPALVQPDTVTPAALLPD